MQPLFGKQKPLKIYGPAVCSAPKTPQTAQFQRLSCPNNHLKPLPILFWSQF
jgi:hypothetical protein